MKPTICFLSLVLLLNYSCGNSENNKLVSRIDSLEKKLNNTYKPGFGEFMSNIQIHHAKLWFAGTNENWELADFEIHEIGETVDAIEKYEPEREESKSVPMMKPALDSISAAIQNKNLAQFKNNYVLLTNTCNNCHKAVNFSFNEVKIPDSPPFSNQTIKKNKGD